MRNKPPIATRGKRLTVLPPKLMYHRDVSSTSSRNFWLSRRSVTKVSILGGDDPVLNPLMNLEVKVGPQETPEDYSCSNLVDTNQR